MSLSSYQYGLRHQLVAITLCNVAFFLLVSLSHQGGTREQLPREERAVLDSMEKDGLFICDHFR
jgi:hypothetical protein